MRWSEDQTVIFVKIYLQHEYLWNTKHEHYGQKYLRKKAYKNISSLFEEATGIKLMEREVMTKLRNLGSTYAQELTKIKKRSDADQPYKPAMKWFHYWYKCKHDNQLVSDDCQTTSDEKMWLLLEENDNNEHATSLPESEINLSSCDSNTKRWGEDETQKFVKIYLQHEILWNPKHTYFRNNKVRKKAYIKICSQFSSTTGKFLTVNEAIIKLRSLKSTYSQELAKIKRLSNPDFTHESTLKWFADWDRCHNAKFSNEELQAKTEVSELSNDEDDEEETVSKQSKSEETSSKLRWSEADTVKFVKIYLQYDFLYNPKHKYYRQKKLRREGYSSVSSEFEAATGIKLNENELKYKIKVLGSCYAQQLAKIRKRAGTDRPYSPTVKWFQYWHKYKYSMQQRNARNAANDSQEPAEDCPVSTFEEEQKFEPDLEESHSQDSESETFKEEQKFEPDLEELSHLQDSESECEVKVKRKKLKSENKNDSNKFSISFVDANADCVREDEFEHFGKYIASILRSMELNKALQLKLEIQNFLRKTQ